MEFRRTLLALFCSGVILSLPGCGGGSSGTPSAPTASSVSGVAMAGRFLSGQICAYQLDNGIQGEQIGCSGFDASSQYSINVGSYSGDVLLAIEAGATYDDEATAGDETNGTPLLGTLRTIVRVNGGSVSAPVTPLTEILVRLLNVLSSEALAAQANTVSSLLPLGSDVNILTTLPALGDSNATQMAYLEILRVLSELQAGKGLSGDLGSYLEMLVSALELNDPETIGDLKSAILTQLQTGLSEYCSVSSDVLSCTPPSGSNQPLACNTSHYSAPVHIPTSLELISFAGIYTGKEGSYSDDFSTFNPSGNAQLMMGVDGSAIYNGTQYPLSSICVEDNGNYGKVMYLELGQGHIDLFAAPYSDGTGLLNWTGSSPADDNKTILGDYVTGGGNNGGGNSGGEGLAIPNGSQITSAADISYLPVINVPDGKIITYKEGSSKAEVYYYVDTLAVSVTDSSLSIGIKPANGCALNPAWATSIPLCTDVGINFDHSAGTIRFDNTPMYPVIFSCPGDCKINGSLNFTPF